MINRVCLAGNLTREPELRCAPSGTYILTYTLAVDERRKNQDGTWDKVPNYFNCTMFGNRAQALHQILAKGMKVCIEGRLKWRQWEQDGTKHSTVGIIVEEIEFMQGGNRQRQAQRVQGSQDANQNGWLC